MHKFCVCYFMNGNILVIKSILLYLNSRFLNIMSRKSLERHSKHPLESKLILIWGLEEFEQLHGRWLPFAWTSLSHFIVQCIVKVIMHMLFEIMQSIQQDKQSTYFCHYLAINIRQYQSKSFKVIPGNSSIVNVSKMKSYKAIQSTLLRLYGTFCVLV